MDRKEREKQRRKRWTNAVRNIKFVTFFGLLIVMGLIGLMWFARPTESVVEKRTLAEFPKLTWSSFWDGSFFSGVETWYADTYPLREGLINLNMSFQDLYGIRTTQIVGGSNTPAADEIPTGDVEIPTNPTPEQTPEPETTAPVEEEPEETGPAEGANDITAPLEMAGSIYVADNCGFGLYYFNQDSAVQYCSYVNTLYQNLGGQSDLYVLLAPISAGILLDESVQEAAGASDENQATEWIYSQLEDGVKTVSVYNTLKENNDEYIYFRTDHHWTALGAHYAYQEFCKQKGFTPHELSEFETMTFEGFLGTFYAQAPSLGSNPDTVTAYIPNGTNTVSTYLKEGGVWKPFDWPIVNDVSNYAKSELYATFAAGDQPFNYAHNEQITDGSSVCVVKNSFGNAFIPFMVDHYEHIYWIDFRYYQEYCAQMGDPNNTISTFAKANDIDDIILLTDISATGNTVLLPAMEQVFR